MNRTRLRTRDDEQGQILVIVAGGMLALLVFLGLVIDGSNAFVNRRNAQNTADIAALDATGLIAAGYTSSSTPGVNVHNQAAVYAALVTSVANNDCVSTGSTPCSWQAWFVGPSGSGPVDLAAVANSTAALPSNTLGVRVDVRRQPGTFLARLANIQTWDINTEAIAVAETPTTAPSGQLLPIGLVQGTYTPGQVYDLTDGKTAPGGFGWLSWLGSPSAPVLSSSLCSPNNPEFTIPTTFTSSSGSTDSSAVRACLDQWIASGQTVLIPIYSTVEGTGVNATYTIVGIASFVITSYDQPAVGDIRGYFVGMYSYINPIPAGVGSGPPKPGDTSVFIGLIK
jgi:hypothetical protein